MSTSRLVAALGSRDAFYLPPAPHFESFTEALSRFGLLPEPEGLSNVSKSEAQAILANLLWKGMAYGEEQLPQSEAEAVANEFVGQYSGGVAFLSNGNWAQSKGWYPMTPATFDSGLVVHEAEGRYSCVWFRDED